MDLDARVSGKQLLSASLFLRKDIDNIAGMNEPGFSATQRSARVPPGLSVLRTRNDKVPEVNSKCLLALRIYAYLDRAL